MEKPDRKIFKQLALELLIEEDPREEGGNGWVSPEVQELRSESARAALELRFHHPVDPTGVGGEEIAWINEYSMLVETGWPWRVAAYIAWCTVPRKFRWPHTQEELAIQVLGLTTDRQIGTWRQKNPAIDTVVAIFQAAPLEAHRQEFFRALIISASNPDYKNHPDRRMALEMTGDYTPKLKAEVARTGESRDLSELSEAELDALSSEVERKLLDRKIGDALEEGDHDPDLRSLQRQLWMKKYVEKKLDAILSLFLPTLLPGIFPEGTTAILQRNWSRWRVTSKPREKKESDE